MAGFAVTRKAVLNAFEARWSALDPTWDHATQTAYPPHRRQLEADQWIKVMTTNQGGRNRAVGILDEVTNLLTVDCYSRVSTDTLFNVDLLADTAHEALRSMVLPAGVDDVEIIPQDLPVTPEGYEHKRVGLIYRFDLPEVT